MAQIKSRKFALPMFNTGDGCAAVINDSAAVGVAQAINDTIDFRIPKGLELGMLRLAWTDMDTGGSPALAAKVGFAPINGSTVVANGVAVSADDDYFAAAAAIGQTAGGQVYAGFPPVVFEEDVYLRITVTTAAATFAAGTIYATLIGAQVGIK